MRAISPHQAIFDRVGRIALARGLTRCSAYAFGRAREASERRAALAHRDGMNIEHIYFELAAGLSLPSDSMNEILRIELQQEADSLRPVESARPLVARARGEAGRIIFVSDMYLPGDFIREQLERHAFWQDGDGLYVSHHQGCTKRTGRLFEIVAASENVRVADIVHLGNHPDVDVRGAKRAGAAGELIQAGNANRYEAALQAHRHATDGLTAAMAGASRLARTGTPSFSKSDDAVAEVSAGVIAPVLTSYVIWLLEQAELRGLRRLYFVSRDGDILLHIAERLAAGLKFDVELRYLYGSRLAWNSLVSSPTKNPHVWHSLIWLSSAGVTNRQMLERTGIGADEIERFTAAPSEQARWNSATDREILRNLLDRIGADGTLERYADQKKGMVVRYFEQEGLFDDVPHGFVDVGWRGTQHDALIEIQKERGVLPATGLFFGLDESGSAWHDLRSAFYFDARKPGEPEPSRRAAVGTGHGPAPGNLPVAKGQPAPRELYSLFEMFCAGVTVRWSVTDRTATGSSRSPIRADPRKSPPGGWTGFTRSSGRSFRTWISNPEWRRRTSTSGRRSQTSSSCSGWSRREWKPRYGAHSRGKQVRAAAVPIATSRRPSMRRSCSAGSALCRIAQRNGTRALECAAPCPIDCFTVPRRR